jgi:hypothetical protein
VKAHAAMLAFAWRQRSAKEIMGQLVRIVAAAVGTWIWVPAGNTGRADVSAFRPMPIPEDLRAVLEATESASCADERIRTSRA